MPKRGLTEMERRIVAFLRARPGSRSSDVCRTLTGHGDCPPCCEKKSDRGVQEALSGLIDRGQIRMERDLTLTLADERL